ncbi:MAG: O-antigen ligase family protein [Snowella sp.]|nr:O-antigen ligase family protein [Snowella sp.]
MGVEHISQEARNLHKNLKLNLKSFPQASFPKAWLGLKWGTMILPFNPILSLLGLLFAYFSVWKKRYFSLIQSPLGLGFAILSILLILTTVFANNRGEAALGLANFIPYFGWFLACHVLLRSFSHLKQLAWVLVLGSLPMVILGLGQIWLGWESPKFLQAIGSNLIAGGRPEGRMSSLLMYANIFAVYLLMVFPLNLGLLSDFYRGWKRDRQRFSTNLLALLGVTALCNAIAIFLTDSRSAWGIAFLIVIAFALYWGWYWLIGMIMALGGMVAWASWGPFAREPLRKIVPDMIWARLSDEMYPDRYMTAYRSTQWEFAWNMMVDRPLFGWGLRNFTPLYQAKMNVWLGHPHSLFVMLLGEIGIPGTLLLMGLIGWILLQATRLLMFWSQQTRSRKIEQYHLLLLSYVIAFASVTAYNCSDVTIFDIRVNLVGWLILAAIAGIVSRYQRLLPSLRIKS